MQANKFHIQAEELREQDKHKEALKVLEKALLEYEEAGEDEGFIQALQSRVLTYKHLFLNTQDKVFVNLAFKDAKKALEVAQEKEIDSMLGSAYFRIGEITMLFGDFKKAVDFYQQALENFKGSNTERGDYKYHLGEALYKSGDKEHGLEYLEDGLNEIQKHRREVDRFLADVWESGALMKLAEILKTVERNRSKQYLVQAQNIIDSNKKLIIRKRQLEKLKQQLVEAKQVV